MKCPFRVDEDGEFKDCYGPDCIAYSEYYRYIPEPPFQNCTSLNLNQIKIVNCRLISSNSFDEAMNC